ncbi:hypothetical protein [Paenibacillus sp. MMS20-IR301]|uniref:hypothetical protein n=1 Tax=Paenibacillus sp. MMS20-IR301 TaxID=2895946 RepID=UPI0028EC2FAD|nr:hypothetical protein [Paenibacillus sp. MMS20-IR301]WNS43281.1 hypothetical protein LOS79_30810 [Paenibacillus sp. MMS20-IR301]
MNDIFFLTNKIISIIDIEKVISSLKIIHSSSSKVAQIYYTMESYAEWAEMKLEEFDDSENSDMLKAKGIKSILCISHHPRDISLIIPQIKSVLITYGGWIGSDSESFEPLYNIENIDQFEYFSS